MRVKDWLEQAKRTISSAEHSLKGGFYEDASYLSHQAAVLAVIGLLIRLGEVETGSSVYYMLKKVKGSTQEVLHNARVLDTYYLPSRYPYCFEKGTPKDYFDEETAKEAIESAKSVLEFVEKQLG